MKNPNAIITSDYGPIIINVNDWAIGRHVAETGFWAAEDIALMRTLLELQLRTRDKVVLYDIGANIGTHSLALSKTFGDRILIRAFEAQRLIFNMLCGTVAINGLANVWCHNVAVSDGSVTQLEVALPDYHRTNNFGALELVQPPRSDNETMVKHGRETVQCVTIDAMAERVDFLKIDIEGMEDRAIAGATKALDAWRPICFVEILKTNTDSLLGQFAQRKYSGFQKAADAIFVPHEYEITIEGLARIL